MPDLKCASSIFFALCLNQDGSKTWDPFVDEVQTFSCTNTCLCLYIYTYILFASAIGRHVSLHFRFPDCSLGPISSRLKPDKTFYRRWLWTSDHISRRQFTPLNLNKVSLKISQVFSNIQADGDRCKLSLKAGMVGAFRNASILAIFISSSSPSLKPTVHIRTLIFYQVWKTCFYQKHICVLNTCSVNSRIAWSMGLQMLNITPDSSICYYLFPIINANLLFYKISFISQTWTMHEIFLFIATTNVSKLTYYPWIFIMK